jgi:hypothetical protein
MARKGSYRRKSHRHVRKHRGGSYSSASTYGTYVNGPVNSQFDRVYGPNGTGGQYTGAQGQNSGIPATLAQRAGSRRKRGGFFGEVINQAIVPFGILGLQQTYGRKRSGGRKTHRRRRH